MKKMKPLRKYPVKNISKDRIQEIHDPVAVETYHTIRVNNTDLITLICSPHDRDSLSIGFLLSTGLINSKDQIRDYTLGEHSIQIEMKSHEPLKINDVNHLLFGRLLTGAKKIEKTWDELLKGLDMKPLKSEFQVSHENVIKACRALSISSEIYRQTGGTHVAGLFDKQGNLIALSEDVGRHNTLDKIIGKAAFLNIKLDKSFITMSSLISADLISKIARVKIPIVASLVNPTSSGISAAKATGVVLIGFANGNQIKIFTHADRIT